MWDRATAKRAAVGVVAWCPAGAGGALVNGALILVMAQAVARMASLMIAGMGRRKGNLCVTSSPPRLDSLKDTFLVRYQRGG